jgi:hypothetical protein
MLDDTPDIGDTEELPDTGDLTDAMALSRAVSGAATRVSQPALARVSAREIVRLARTRLGEQYVLGARAPMANGDWHGPWDCAEFASWCVFQASGVLYGTRPRNDPMLADAYTGYWAEQSRADGQQISVQQAASIEGSLVLRRPIPGATGHIVLSDGRGGTVEAHSTARGVIESTLSGRRWDTGILVPGIEYLLSDQHVTLKEPPAVLRLTQPLTAGKSVRKVQERLAALDLAVGRIDGIYGPQTARAVRQFQDSAGLVPDGEVGPQTRTALGLGK